MFTCGFNVGMIVSLGDAELALEYLNDDYDDASPETIDDMIVTPVNEEEIGREVMEDAVSDIEEDNEIDTDSIDYEEESKGEFEGDEDIEYEEELDSDEEDNDENDSIDYEEDNEGDEDDNIDYEEEEPDSDEESEIDYAWEETDEDIGYEEESDNDEGIEYEEELDSYEDEDNNDTVNIDYGDEDGTDDSIETEVEEKAVCIEEHAVKIVDKPSNKKIQSNEEDISLLARQKELELREKELQLKELELRLMGQVHQKELENKEVAMRNRLKELELQEKEMLLANKALRLQGISSKLKNEVNVKKTVKPVKNSDNKIKETKQIKEIEKNKEVVENTAKKEKTVKKTNDTSRYEGMEVNLLYRYVVSYMKKQGVIDRGVKQDILIKRFGAVNIQKLINKNYLIKLADSTVTCNR